MYIPIESNKCGIDFVLGDVLFQATIALSHDVKAEGIIAVSHQFRDEQNGTCVFAFPQSDSVTTKSKQLTTKNCLLVQELRSHSTSWRLRINYLLLINYLLP